MLYPNLFFDPPSNHCFLAGFAKLQVTTPHTPVPSHNNFSRGSNRRYNLYMRSSSWCCLISLKSISLRFLAKCPYLLHKQYSVSVFRYNLLARLSPSFPVETVLYIIQLNLVEFYSLHTHTHTHTHKHIYIYVCILIPLTVPVPVSVCQTVPGPVQQTPQSNTPAGYSELR